MMDTACASGSRRSSAGLAVSNALNAADLVAAVVEPEFQSRLAECVRRELEASPFTRVLPVPRTAAAPECHCGAYPAGADRGAQADAEKLRRLLAGIADGDPSVRRSILLLNGLDDLLNPFPQRFDRLVDSLCAALQSQEAIPQRPTGHRAVLIGSDAMLHRLQSLDSECLRAIRFRYVLVR